MKGAKEKLEDAEERYLRARKRTKELYGKELINYIKKVTGWGKEVIEKRLKYDVLAIAMLMGLMQDNEARELIIKMFIAITDEAWAAYDYIKELGGKTDP